MLSRARQNLMYAWRHFWCRKTPAFARCCESRFDARRMQLPMIIWWKACIARKDECWLALRKPRPSMTVLQAKWKAAAHCEQQEPRFDKVIRTSHALWKYRTYFTLSIRVCRRTTSPILMPGLPLKIIREQQTTSIFLKSKRYQNIFEIFTAIKSQNQTLNSVSFWRPLRRYWKRVYFKFFPSSKRIW